MSSMAFWGVEVKAGEPLTVEPEDIHLIHLSQACLGETKNKGSEPITLSVKVDDKKFVLGILSLDKTPQLSFDLIFEKEVEFSHNWKHGSIYLSGYQTEIPCDEEDEDEYDDLSDEEEDMPPIAIQNGKGGPKVEDAKPDAAKTIAAKPQSSEKPKVKVGEPSKVEDDNDEDSDDSDDDSDDEISGDDSDQDVLDGDSDDDDDEDDSDEEDDEETPKKPESKKRANESGVKIKTPVPAKKAKGVASPKSDGKKGGHTATPHPAKKAAKTPATGDKSKGPQTPKSGGKSGGISCKSCSKTFGSDQALDSHTKAKHA